MDQDVKSGGNVLKQFQATGKGRDPAVPSIEILTSIRFFAAIWVVFHHFGAALVPKGLFFLENIRSRGGAGVSLFFVLSGFILFYNYAGRAKVAIFPFLSARFARIYPLYFVSILLSFPFFLDQLVGIHGTLEGGIQGSKQLLLCLAMMQAWIPLRATVLNPPGWSLSAEWFFYAMFPFVIHFGWIRNKLGRVIRSGSCLWVISLLAMFLLPLLLESLVAPVGDSTWSRFSLFLTAFHPIIRFPEFLIGCALGSYYLSGKKVPYPRVFFGSSISAILLMVCFFPHSFLEPVLRTSLLTPLFGLLMISIASLDADQVRWMKHPWLIFLGEASFGLYILHEPVRLWISWLLQLLGLNLHDGLKSILMTVGSILVSALAFRFLEKPLRPKIREGLQKIPRIISRWRRHECKGTDRQCS